MSTTAGYVEPARRSECASTKAPSPYESLVASVTHARSEDAMGIVIVYLVMENFGVTHNSPSRNLLTNIVRKSTTSRQRFIQII